jgi:hypothetical protein
MSEKYPLWRRLREEIFSQLIRDQWGPYVKLDFGPETDSLVKVTFEKKVEMLCLNTTRQTVRDFKKSFIRILQASLYPKYIYYHRKSTLWKVDLMDFKDISC